jgi:hypothetical protein
MGINIDAALDRKGKRKKAKGSKKRKAESGKLFLDG